MKTLLLSLIGIAGAASSSIIPIVANNHYSVNQIKSVEPKTAEFSYTLDTNYKNIDGEQTHDHSKEFSDFFSKLKNFIEDNNVLEWTITQAWSKFGKVEKKDFLQPLINRLNKVLHYNDIIKVEQQATTRGPNEPDNLWHWALSVTTISPSEGTHVSTANVYTFTIANLLKMN